MNIGDLRNIKEAPNYADTVLEGIQKDDYYLNLLPAGQRAVVVIYLEACVWERLDFLATHDDQERSYYTKDVVRTLREGLRLEPGNALSEGEPRRRLETSWRK